MKLETWEALNRKAKEVEALEKQVLALENLQRSTNLPDVAIQSVSQTRRHLRKVLAREKRVPLRILRDMDEPLFAFIDGTHGLGSGLAYLLGHLPPLTAVGGFPGFSTEWKVFKYVGLHVVDGEAPKRKRGNFSGFSGKLRAYATVRLVDPVIKNGGPFRAVYDERKEETLESHPPMLADGDLAHPDCPTCNKAVGWTERHREDAHYSRERTTVGKDCSNMGGDHWTKGHRHRDAIRVTAKAIIRDAWRVEHGRSPVIGHIPVDDQREPANAG
jgi:hypothetical protein